jgi:hypothetical protein
MRSDQPSPENADCEGPVATESTIEVRAYHGQYRVRVRFRLLLNPEGPER